MCVSNAARLFLAADDVKGMFRFDLISLLLNANFKCKIVIERYLRCLYGHKKKGYGQSVESILEHRSLKFNDREI